MRLCMVLAMICLMFSAVFGLKCYSCLSANPGTCTKIEFCSPIEDRCSSTIVAENLITKKCMSSVMCTAGDAVGVRCCDEDLCNGAKHTAVFVPLLLVPFTLVTLFI